MEELFFQCPHCWEEVSVLIDPSINDQEFIEDCEVCCNPLQFSLQLQYKQVLDFKVEILGQ